LDTDKISQNKNISGLSFREILAHRDFLLMRKDEMGVVRD
jgi:hypothetical protein